MGYHQWLEANHLFQFQKDLFDGTIDLGFIPIPPFGYDVMRQMNNINHSYGKISKSSKKREREDAGSLIHDE